MKKVLLIAALFSCIAFQISYTHAQTLRWGRSGGSAADDGRYPAADESVVDMATDPNGNIYVLWNGGLPSVTGIPTYYIDGHAMTGYGGGDIVLSSFTCNGTFRWSKVFGGNDDDIPAAIRTDALGGVYILGKFATHYINIHLDADTSWSTGASYKTLFIVKYDTAGHYKWLRMPEPDTAGINAPSYTRPVDMDVDSAGNIYSLWRLYPGAYGDGSYVVTDTGVHVLKYNSTGTFMGGTHMQIGCTGMTVHALYLKRDFDLGRYYVTGWGAGISTLVDNLTFNGTPVLQPLFIGAFDNAGAFLWVKNGVSTLSKSFGRAAIDAAHNIYMAGVSQAFGAVDTFNGYPVINPVSSSGNAPLIVKMDTAGNNIWAKNASSENATYMSSIALSGSTVTVAGAYNGKLLCPGFDSLNHPSMSGDGYDVFIIQMDAVTGNFARLDSVTSDMPDYEFATGIAADEHGNVYVGGSMSGMLYVNTDTLVSAGGGSDFFIVKYGYDNCGCTTTPVANYTYTGASAIHFAYSGTTTALDSVVWNFGDGGHATGTAVSHTYSVAGTYHACATVYTGCGSNTYCHDIIVSTTAIPNMAFPRLAIYPNPTTGALFIEHAPPAATLKLYNVMGQQVYSGVVTGPVQQLDISGLPGGSYILQIMDDSGNRMNMHLVKL